MAPKGGELGGSILEPSPSHYRSLLLSSLPMKADLPHGLDPKPSFSEVWLLHALPPEPTQASNEKSVLVRHHHGSCMSWGTSPLSEETACPPEHSKGLLLEQCQGKWEHASATHGHWLNQVLAFVFYLLGCLLQSRDPREANGRERSWNAQKMKAERIEATSSLHTGMVR